MVRYGERVAFPLDNGLSVTVGDYIIQQLESDDIEAPNALYKRIIDEYKAHCHDEGFVAERFFKFHEDPQISSLAVDLISDKYQLSRIFAHQSISENVVQEVKLQTDADHLPELLMQLILELKYTIVNQRIDELEKLMKEAEANGDQNLVMQLLASQPQLLNVKNAISKQLGNRVITL